MTTFDTHAFSAEYLMTVNNLNVGLNMPPALKSQKSGDEEYVHGLPQYRPRKAFLVDEYPACPDSWMRSSGRIKSFFVPVIDEHGLWLDFNSCLNKIGNHVAIVVSAQGVNAITGLPCKDAALQQFRDKCPKHDIEFGPDRLCKKCKHKWPKQNYLASTGTPMGSLWLDGFRSADGVIRQYVMTKQKSRGVAAAIIGDERVFAIGISFFLSKEPRPPQHFPTRSNLLTNSLGGDYTTLEANAMGYGTKGLSSDGGGMWGSNITYSASCHSGNLDHYMLNSAEKCVEPPSDGKPRARSSRTLSANNASGALRGRLMASNMPMAAASASNAAPPIAVNMVQVEAMEMAAGAKVNQRVYDDPNDLEFWQKEPEGLIVINYCSEKEAEAIIKAGKVGVNGSPEGFLQEVKTGH